MKNKKCLVCGKDLIGKQKKYCSNKCSHYYCYYHTKPGRIKKKPISQTHKLLMREWDYEENDKLGLDPNKLTAGSGKKALWICKKNTNHKWVAVIAKRNQGRGCPYCAGKKVCVDNCLETNYPEIAQEWNSEKNEKLTSKEITCGSSKKIWWECLKNHNHKWKTSVKHRVNGSSCPYCCGQKTCKDNCLKTTNPILSKEWHPTKNNLTSEEITYGSTTKVWWLCKKNHEWVAPVYARSIQGSGCPYCASKKACKENCLQTKYPKFSKEWDFIKNNELTPEQVTYSSHKKAHWICKKGHTWETTVNTRTNQGSGCPICANEKMRGKNNPNYNPKLTDQDREDRRVLPEYVNWRKEVYERDNYTCQICGDNSGGNLNAHHFVNYNQHPEQRFDKNNGTTLCVTCHIDFHHIYGRQNNTLHQFKEYEASCLLGCIKIN